MQANVNESTLPGDLSLSKLRHDLVSAVGLLHSANYNLAKEKPNVDLAKFFCGELITRIDSLVSHMDEVLSKEIK